MDIHFEKKLFIGFSIILFHRMLGRFPTNEEWKKILQDETTNNENKKNDFKMSEFIREKHPGEIITLSIPLHHVNEIYITGRGVLKKIELEILKEENKAFLSTYMIRKSIWERILQEIEETINKE